MVADMMSHKGVSPPWQSVTSAVITHHYHLQALYGALEKIVRPAGPTGDAQTLYTLSPLVNTT